MDSPGTLRSRPSLFAVIRVLVGAALLALAALMVERVGGLDSVGALRGLVAAPQPSEEIIPLISFGGDNDSGRDELHLFDLVSGQVRRSIDLGDLPLLIVASRRGELLISEFADGRARLRVLDRTGGRVRGMVEMPDRAGYTLYGPGWMVLSSDERLLYYRKHRMCGLGCDEHWIGTIDLDRLAEVATVPLPRNCGARLLRGTEEGVLFVANCPLLPSVGVLTHGGIIESIVPPGGESPVAAGVSGGAAYKVFADGRFQLIFRSGSVLHEVDALDDPNHRFSVLRAWRLDESRAALGVVLRGGSSVDGVVILDTTGQDAPRRVRLPAHATPAWDALPLPDGRIAVIHQRTLSVIDLASERATRQIPLHRNWLEFADKAAP